MIKYSIILPLKYSEKPTKKSSSFAPFSIFGSWMDPNRFDLTWRGCNILHCIVLYCTVLYCIVVFLRFGFTSAIDQGVLLEKLGHWLLSRWGVSDTSYNFAKSWKQLLCCYPRPPQAPHSNSQQCGTFRVKWKSTLAIIMSILCSVSLVGIYILAKGSIGFEFIKFNFNIQELKSIWAPGCKLDSGSSIMKSEVKPNFVKGPSGAIEIWWYTNNEISNWRYQGGFFL